MDVNQVLQNTLSPDDATRKSAEQQLTQAAEADFSGYLITLARELANDQAQPANRIAAGLALKNSFSARDYNRLREVQQRWIQQIDPNVKKSVKDLALQTLGSKDGRAGQSAGQFIASIAAIELPRNEWQELMPTLVQNVGSGEAQLKQASLVTIGYICESDDTNLRESLVAHSNSILTAVVQGARKEEENPDVRYSAITALSDSLDFVKTNFENEGERNYIMQVVCEATQSDDNRIQAGAYGCLNRIMNLYYDKMKFYMEKALYGLTIVGMRNEEEDVAKLAIEFWCTVCEEELAVEDDLEVSRAEGLPDARVHWGFARIASREVVPAILELMTKQDEDASDDDYNVSRAAYQCLQLFAQVVRGELVEAVVRFIEQNIKDSDWHNRDAAVSAYGAIMEGPEEHLLDPLIKQGLPVLLEKMRDDAVQVRDSAAFAIGRVCESMSEAINQETQLPDLIQALFTGLSSNPKMAGSCCWALMNLANRFGVEDPKPATSALSPHFQASVSALLAVTENNADNQLRMAAYEVLNTFVEHCAQDCIGTVASLSDVVLGRLEATIPMQQQIVSVEDRITLEEIQTSLSSAVFAIVRCLESEIRPQADRIMNVMLQLLSTVGPKSSVPDTVFATVGSLANALEADFVKYMDAFTPFLYNALGNQEEPGLCSMAIGLVSDIARSLGEGAQPYCDHFMNYLLNNLRSTALSNQFKPAILQCFGDIAQAIGLHFETYLSVVAQVLQQAANVSLGADGPYDMLDYIVSLREGIMDAWAGIIIAMKPKVDTLNPSVQPIFQLLVIVADDNNRSESLLRSAMGVIGDLADAFPNGEYADFFREEAITRLIKDTRTNRDFSSTTTETARWAREQVKRQGGAQGGVLMT
ncbi:karyopherin beta [Agyrium rufum]|nr:karyopherin beta [Agyrium rufum]